MGIFNKFTDTIFYKKDSELEIQIETLKKLLEKYPNNENLKHRLKICELGLYGENAIEFELKNASIGMYVLRDINLKYQDLTAQIDYIIITPGYIYFVECKNLIGNITVNNRGEFIREYYYNGKKIKEGIYSPIRQAERHIEVFKKIWTERKNGILDKIFREQRQAWFKPLVILSNAKNILNIKYAPKELKNKIIKSDALIDYIRKDIAKIDKSLLSDRKAMDIDAWTILENYNQTIHRNYEAEFLKMIKEENLSEFSNNNSKLKNDLLLFRKNRAKEKNIPAYYIFNNEELDKLLEIKPITIEELRKSKILPDIKINSHGKEIIKIMQNDMIKNN